MSTIRRSSALLLAALAIAAVFFAASQEIDTAQSGAHPEMALVVNPHGERCTDVCAIPLGGTFTLAVEIVTAPAGGYIGAETFIDYGDNLSYDIAARPIESEIIWPDVDYAVAVRASTGAGLTNHGGLSSLMPLLPVSTYTGSFVEIDLTCSEDDTSTQVDLLPYRDFQANTSGAAFATFDPNTQRTEIVVPNVDSIQIDCGAGGPLDTPTPIQPPTETPTPWPTFQGPTPRPPATVSDLPTEPGNGFVPPLGGGPGPTPTPGGRTLPGNGLFIGDTLTGLEDEFLGFFDAAITTTATVCRGPASVADATVMLQWHAQLIGGEPCSSALDVTGDGVIDSRDAAVVLQYAAGLIATLPP